MRIVVPLDGSALAESVLPCVEDLARRVSAEVHFVQVMSLDASLLVAASAGRDYTPRLLALELQAEADRSRGYLRRIAEQWTARGVSARWEVLRGNAARCIVEYAAHCGADLIAMSTHGRSGVARLILGSVAERVVREARVPVLLFRPSAVRSPERPPVAHAAV